MTARIDMLLKHEVNYSHWFFCTATVILAIEDNSSIKDLAMLAEGWVCIFTYCQTLPNMNVLSMKSMNARMCKISKKCWSSQLKFTMHKWVAFKNLSKMAAKWRLAVDWHFLAWYFCVIKSHGVLSTLRVAAELRFANWDLAKLYTPLYWNRANFIMKCF